MTENQQRLDQIAVEAKRKADLVLMRCHSRLGILLEGTGERSSEALARYYAAIAGISPGDFLSKEAAK